MSHVKSSPAISDLESRLASSDLAARRQAAEELLQSEISAPGIAPFALQALADEDEGVHEALVGWLENCGTPSGDDVGTLLPLLLARGDDQVYWTITLLGRLGSEAPAAVGPLIDKLDERHPLAIRERAAWALGKIGAAASAARAKLEALTTCDKPRLGRLAAEALREIV